MARSLETYASMVDTAIATFEQQRARLFNTDGNPIYAEQEQQRRMDALLEALHRTVEQFNDVVDEHVTMAQELLVHLRGDDLLDTLTNTELERAALLAPFVREDVEHEPLLRLVDRMAKVHVSGD